MTLNKTSEYALRILIFMAKDSSQLYTAKQLVNTLKVSDKYLRRIMTNLSKDGFIKSLQGRDGGYVFVKSPNEITLYDIIDSVEGMEKLNNCILGFESCSCENPCAMHTNWQEMRIKLLKLYKETKLSNVNFESTVKY